MVFRGNFFYFLTNQNLGMGRQTSVCAVVTPSGGMLLLASLASRADTLVITVDQVSTALRRAPAERRGKPGALTSRLLNSGESPRAAPPAPTRMHAHAHARASHAHNCRRPGTSCMQEWLGRTSSSPRTRLCGW
jgi:hypothetical protein